jgi:hypothetical protein
VAAFLCAARAAGVVPAAASAPAAPPRRLDGKSLAGSGTRSLGRAGAARQGREPASARLKPRL